jgi:hypothetical protein
MNHLTLHIAGRQQIAGAAEQREREGDAQSFVIMVA